MALAEDAAAATAAALRCLVTGPEGAGTVRREWRLGIIGRAMALWPTGRRLLRGWRWNREAPVEADEDVKSLLRKSGTAAVGAALKKGIFRASQAGIRLCGLNVNMHWQNKEEEYVVSLEPIRRRRQIVPSSSIVETARFTVGRLIPLDTPGTKNITH